MVRVNAVPVVDDSLRQGFLGRSAGATRTPAAEGCLMYRAAPPDCRGDRWADASRLRGAA